MNAPSNIPVLASASGTILWTLLAVAWVIIQAGLKNSRKKTSGSHPPDNQSGLELEEFFAQLAEQTKAAAQAKKPPRPTPPRVATAPARSESKKKPERTRDSRPSRPARIASVPPLKKPAQSTIGAESGRARPSPTASAPSFVRALSSPSQWRRAIILREVIGPPKALRRFAPEMPGSSGQ